LLLDEVISLATDLPVDRNEVGLFVVLYALVWMAARLVGAVSNYVYGRLEQSAQTALREKHEALADHVLLLPAEREQVDAREAVKAGVDGPPMSPVLAKADEILAALDSRARRDRARAPGASAPVDPRHRRHHAPRGGAPHERAAQHGDTKLHSQSRLGLSLMSQASDNSGDQCLFVR
jgi:hypothetical protein